MPAHQKSSLTALYDYLSKEGQKGVREVAKDRFGGDVVQAKMALDELVRDDLIREFPGIQRMGGDDTPRHWEVIDPV